MEAGHPGNAPVILRIQAPPATSTPPPDVTLTPLRISPSTHLQEGLAQRFGNGVRIVPVASPGVSSVFIAASPCRQWAATHAKDGRIIALGV